MSDELVAIYADESCLGNGRDGDNPGAAGVLVEYQRRGGGLVRRDLWVSERATTNNRMALRSVSEAMRAIGAKGGRFRVCFTTDSRYIVDGMTKWVHGWARNDWKRKTGAIENLELWKDAIRACQGHAIAWHWVRGHSGHAQNEFADHLANRAATEQTSSLGLVDSEFDDWMAAQLAGRKQVRPPGAFPDGATFTPNASLPRV
ncbi:MAG: ribonuclease H [Gemmatimonadota bacterium]